MFGEGAVAGVVGIAAKVIDRIFPDQTERDKAKLAMLQMEQSGELDFIKTQLSAIVTEAQSNDPWTSRARPSFLYVIYIMILASLPMGILHAFEPEVAVSIADGMKAWLQAVPESLWALFGAGYLGYVGARSLDKRKK